MSESDNSVLSINSTEADSNHINEEPKLPLPNNVVSNVKICTAIVKACITPADTIDPIAAIEARLNCLVMQYYSVIGGLVLGYENIRLIDDSMGRIRPQTDYIELTAEVSFIIFSATKDDIIMAEVRSITPSGIMVAYRGCILGKISLADMGDRYRFVTEGSPLIPEEPEKTCNYEAWVNKTVPGEIITAPALLRCKVKEYQPGKCGFLALSMAEPGTGLICGAKDDVNAVSGLILTSTAEPITEKFGKLEEEAAADETQDGKEQSEVRNYGNQESATEYDGTSFYKYSGKELTDDDDDENIEKKDDDNINDNNSRSESESEKEKENSRQSSEINEKNTEDTDAEAKTNIESSSDSDQQNSSSEGSEKNDDSISELSGEEEID